MKLEMLVNYTGINTYQYIPIHTNTYQCLSIQPNKAKKNTTYGRLGVLLQCRCRKSTMPGYNIRRLSESIPTCISKAIDDRYQRVHAGRAGRLQLPRSPLCKESLCHYKSSDLVLSARGGPKSYAAYNLHRYQLQLSEATFSHRLFP